MNIEGIKGSIDLSTENVFKELDRLESRLNKFADSRGNDGDVIANEMKTILNVIAGSQIEFADNLKKAFDTIEEQHLAYGRKARRIERDVTKAMVAEMVERNQAFANAYAKSSQDFLDSQTKLMNANRQLTMSKLADREDRNKDRAAGKIKAEELARDREIAEQANEIFMRSMAQQKEKERAIRELAELRMADFRRRKKEHEETVRLEKKTQKEQEAAVKASLERRRKLVRSFASGATKILKGIVWFPVIANQTMQMFQGVGYTLKAIWDSTLGQIIKVGAEVESYMVRLKVSTGTLMAAREVWKDIEKFATESVFGFDESVQSAVSLIPVLRQGRDELSKWQPIIADISAGFGLSYEEATSNFIKAYAGGIAAADLFRERGISAALGFIPGEKVSGKDTADQIYEAWASANSVFRGAAAELATTWNGIINKIKDQWFLFVKDVGEADLFKEIKFGAIFVLKKFEDLRASGQEYNALINGIADSLVNVYRLVVRFFTAFIDGMLNIPIIGSRIAEAFKTDEERYLTELTAQREEILGNVQFRDTGQAQKALHDLDNQISEMKSKVEAQGDPFASLKKSIHGIIPEWYQVTKAQEQYFEDAKRFGGELAVDPHILAAQGIKERKIDSSRRQELVDKQLSQMENATREATDKIQANLEKAKLGSIKYAQGEWAAFVEETSIAAKKLGLKVSKDLSGTNPNAESIGSGIAGQYISSELASKIAEYKDELKEIVRVTEEEMSKLGMTEYESAKFDVGNEFASNKWKNQSDEVKIEIEKAKQAKISLLDEEEARRKNNETLQYEQALRAALIPSWNTYRQQLTEITNEYELATKNVSDLAIAEAKLKRDRGIDILNANTTAGAKSQIEDLQFQLSQFGKTESEKKLAEINRELRYLTDPTLGPEINALGERLLELNKKIADREKLTQFSDGWQDAMAEIKDSMMTDGQAIKTFMTNIFSELSSTLSDVFFRVFKGELDSAAEAFEAFADAIMKSISDIMANQIASQLMGGAMSMFAGIFHTGGVAGMGGSQRSVNPLMFIGAPRYHSGGIAGLAPGEIPAVLKAGEIIQTPEQYARRNSGGGVSVAIKNESGQTLKVTESRATQDMSGWVISVVLDAVQRDRGGLRSALRG